MAVTVSASSRRKGPSEGSLILGAALCAALGIGLSITENVDYGRWLAVFGVLLLIVGLHRFGRLGPDEPLRAEAPLPRRKKKKQKKRAEE